MLPLVLLGIGAVLAVLIVTGSWMPPEIVLGAAVVFSLTAIANTFMFAIHGPRILDRWFAQIRKVVNGH